FGNGMQVAQLSTGSTEEIPQAVSLSAFPNPVNDNVLTIVNNNNLQRAAQLTDVNGRDVLQLSLQQGRNEIDVSALSPGVYFLRSETEVLRIVIAR
ncbi:MAG: T9SS type A sorting domain-containing protein, partial [Bacteroidia bacterium]